MILILKNIKNIINVNFLKTDSISLDATKIFDSEDHFVACIEEDIEITKKFYRELIKKLLENKELDTIYVNDFNKTLCAKSYSDDYAIKCKYRNGIEETYFTYEYRHEMKNKLKKEENEEITEEILEALEEKEDKNLEYCDKVRYRHCFKNKK